LTSLIDMGFASGLLTLQRPVRVGGAAAGVK
jgi:hypothetical protein